MGRPRLCPPEVRQELPKAVRPLGLAKTMTMDYSRSTTHFGGSARLAQALLGDAVRRDRLRNSKVYLAKKTRGEEFLIFHKFLF